MGALAIIVMVCTSFIFLTIQPHHLAKAISIITPADSGNQNVGRVSGTQPSLSGDQMIKQQTKVIVCEGLQSMVPACAQVPRLDDFMKANKGGFTSPGGRKRRFANFGFGISDPFSNSWFGPSSGGSNSFHSFNPWPSSNNKNNSHGFNNFHSFSSFGSGHKPISPGINKNNSNVIICPSQTNQSKVFRLNPDPTGYPVVGIATELNNDPVLRACLFREVVLQGTPPNITIDSFRDSAIRTCPFSERRLWRYQSNKANSECFIMQNFQEDVLFRRCRARSCVNCKSRVVNRLRQKLCITDYVTVSTWSYCPQLTKGKRIIRDRIIIPLTCSCQSVLCEQIPQWRK